jgi:hypothetical protein
MSLDKMSQPSRKAVEVNALEENKKIKFTVDSGAADSLQEIRRQRLSYESLTKYIMPNGEIVENDGEKHLKVKTAEGEKFIVRTQLPDVRKPLMSVSKVCDEGNIVVFKQNGVTSRTRKRARKQVSAEKETSTLLRWTGPAK